jgi:hypothetical protein
MRDGIAPPGIVCADTGKIEPWGGGNGYRPMVLEQAGDGISVASVSTTDPMSAKVIDKHFQANHWPDSGVSPLGYCQP